MTRTNETKAARTASLGWMIHRIAGRLDREMAKRLSAKNMNVQQFAVMMTVLEADDLTQKDIGKKFDMPPYAISRALDHLEKAGYLKRSPHPTSRRTHVIRATNSGRALAPSLFTIIQEVNADLVADLSQADHAVFRRILVDLL